MIYGYFNSCYLLNLERRYDRLLAVKAECARVGIAFRRVIGKIFTEKDYPHLPQEGILRERLPAIGNANSHREAIRLGKELNATACIILEDDAMFSEAFPVQIPKIVEYLRGHEWDLLQFWSRHDHSVKVTKELKRLTDGTTGAHAYAIHRRFFDRFLREFNPPKSGGTLFVDVYFLRLKNAVKLATVDNLVLQRSGYSDIRGCLSHISSV
jgi:GR25 family glycosyltransferase involved in LPS biosynthesis